MTQRVTDQDLPAKVIIDPDGLQQNITIEDETSVVIIDDGSVPGPRGYDGVTGATGSGVTGAGVTGATGAASTVPGSTGATGAASTVPGSTGATGAVSTVPGSTGATGAASTVPGSTGATGAASTVPGSTGATGAASTIPGSTGATGAASTVPGSTGATGAASTVPGSTGATGAASTVPGVTGATGAASTVPGSTGATGAASTVPGATGATGAASTVPGSTGATGADSTVPGVTGATGAASTVPGSTGATGAASTVPGSTGATGADSTVPGATGATGAASTVPGATGATGADGQVSGQTLYFSSVAGDTGAYESLLQYPSLNTEDDDSVSVSSGDGEVELGGYLTIPGYPGTTQIQAGIWTFNIYHYVNNTAGDTTFVYRVYKIATGGAETELFNVTSDPVDATSATLVSTQYVLVSPIALDATDRLICKVFAQTTSGASITAHFVYEGSTHVSNIGSTLVVSGLRGATGSTGAASTVPGSTGATGAASTVPGSTGATGAASTVPGSTGATGAASTVPGATGATGAASTVPGSTGATGAASTVPGSTGATGAASTVPGVTGATGAAGATGVGSTGPQGATGPLISASDEQTLSYDAGLPGWRARDSLKVGNDGIVGIHRGSTGACGDLRAYNDNDTSYGRLHMNDNNIDFDILVEGAAPRDITVGRGGDMGAFWVGPDPGNDQRPSFKHSGHPDGNTGITMESYVEDEASDKNYRFTGVDRFHFDGYLGIPAGSGGKFVHNGATGIDDIIHAIGEDFTVSGGIVTEATATTSIAGYPADGRLTLTSGTPVTTSDVTAATTLYYTPYIGNKIALYDGSNWDILEFTEISTACDAGVAATLDATQMYDVFVYNDSGTATLELLAWTDDSTRATALVYQDGVLVKSGAATRRYIGSFRTGGSGVTDALKYRTLWNTYNRVDRKVYTSDSNAHSYTTTSWRLWRNTTSNEVFVVSGLEEDAVTLTCNGYCDVDSAYMGIDEDGTTPDNTLDPKIGFVKTGYHFVIGTWTYYPAAGYHYYALCQYGGSGADFNYGTMVGKVRC